MKKSLSLLCAILLIFSLGACGKTNPDSPYASTTVTGEVINADGTSLTLRLGELISGGVFDEDSPTVSFVDENGNNEKNESENMVPPERPNGETNDGNMAPPERPNGETNDENMTPPERPNGEANDENMTPPERPNGEANDGSMAPPERPNGGMNVSGMTPPEYFTAGEETLTVIFQTHR